MASTNRAAAERALGLFDRQLEGHPFVAGERITMADIVLAIGLDFARMVRFVPPEALSHVARWRGEVTARPGAKAGA